MKMLLLFFMLTNLALRSGKDDEKAVVAHAVTKYHKQQSQLAHPVELSYLLQEIRKSKNLRTARRRSLSTTVVKVIRAGNYLDYQSGGMRIIKDGMQQVVINHERKLVLIGSTQEATGPVMAELAGETEKAALAQLASASIIARGDSVVDGRPVRMFLLSHSLPGYVQRLVKYYVSMEDTSLVASATLSHGNGLEIEKRVVIKELHVLSNQKPARIADLLYTKNGKLRPDYNGYAVKKI